MFSKNIITAASLFLVCGVTSTIMCGGNRSPAMRRSSTNPDEKRLPQNELITTIRTGNYKKIKASLKEGCTVTPHCFEALAAALTGKKLSKKQITKITNLIIDSGFDINMHDQDGNTPLSLVFDTELITQLLLNRLNHGATVPPYTDAAAQACYQGNEGSLGLIIPAQARETLFSDIEWRKIVYAPLFIKLEKLKKSMPLGTMPAENFKQEFFPEGKPQEYQEYINMCTLDSVFNAINAKSINGQITIRDIDNIATHLLSNISWKVNLTLFDLVLLGAYQQSNRPERAQAYYTIVRHLINIAPNNSPQSNIDYDNFDTGKYNGDIDAYIKNSVIFTISILLQQAIEKKDEIVVKFLESYIQKQLHSCPELSAKILIRPLYADSRGLSVAIWDLMSSCSNKNFKKAFNLAAIASKRMPPKNWPLIAQILEETRIARHEERQRAIAWEKYRKLMKTYPKPADGDSDSSDTESSDMETSNTYAKNQRAIARENHHALIQEMKNINQMNKTHLKPMDEDSDGNNTESSDTDTQVMTNDNPHNPQCLKRSRSLTRTQKGGRITKLNSNLMASLQLN